MSRPSTVDHLLDRADAEREAGRGDAAARLYDEAITLCRTENDLARWTRAVLGAASVYVFGTEPGKLPAQLYDALVRTTDDTNRARLAAALARCWVYAGQAARAVPFAAEAVERAERADRPEVLADSLDAALAAHWGPDELDVRVELAAQLDEVAAHVLYPGTRLQAHLWGLQVACEALDVQAIHRHIRALENLGEESPRALFFAASRRLMLDLLRGRTDTSAQLIEVAAQAGERASLADAWMVVEAMKGYSALQSGDATTCAEAAEKCERLALSEGATVLCAEAAYMWLGAGRLDRARMLVRTFHGRVLDDLPRDVNWLLILQGVLEAALAVGDTDVVATCARLLGPYAGRAVFNAGAVMFHGVTDDTLARAMDTLGEHQGAAPLRERALATYERLGASWWRDRLRAWPWSAATRPSTTPPSVRLHPAADGLWVVGPDSDALAVRAVRGYTYLRELLRRPGQPVSALDLVTDGLGGVVQRGLGDVVDRQALDAYRRRLRDIERDLAEAQDWSDSGRVEALQNEREALLDEIAAATGLGGRARTTGSSNERARVAATKAITAAIARIASVNESLGRHLRATIHTGTFCSYEPAPEDGVTWVLDPHVDAPGGPSRR